MDEISWSCACYTAQHVDEWRRGGISTHILNLVIIWAYVARNMLRLHWPSYSFDRIMDWLHARPVWTRWWTEERRETNPSRPAWSSHFTDWDYWTIIVTFSLNHETFYLIHSAYFYAISSSLVESFPYWLDHCTVSTIYTQKVIYPVLPRFIQPRTTHCHTPSLLPFRTTRPRVIATSIRNVCHLA